MENQRVKTEPPKILAIALEDNLVRELKSISSSMEIDCISKEEEFGQKFETLVDGDYALIVSGCALGSSFLFEVGQIVQNQCPRTLSVAFLISRENLDLKKLSKNGFKEIYLMPLDSKLFKKRTEEVLAKFTGKKIFRKIKSHDLYQGTVLNFDTYIYLPLNKKFIKYSKSKEELSAQKVESLQKKNVGNLHIDQNDLEAFYEYSAENLAKFTNDANPLSETEKKEKVNEAVRDFLLDIYDDSELSDFQSGKEMLATCQKVISNYITKGESSNWYNNLIRSLSGDVGGYSHSSEVSTIAALFGIALGHKNPEDLAMAGFLHDLGMIDLPEELREMDMKLMTEEERELYKSHPEKSLNYIKRKKIIIPKNVEMMILQHHEKFNGTGFPKALSGDRISEESQILILADQFQYIMEEKEGKKRIQPLEALEILEKGGFASSSVIKKIKAMMTPNEEDQKG